MERASEIEAWLRNHTAEVLRCRLRVWAEGRPETRRRYWLARLGPHRLYLGGRPDLRDHTLECAARIREFFFGRDATLREMVPVWSAARGPRPSWKKLRDRLLSERGEYFKGGRIRRRRARASQNEGATP